MPTHNLNEAELRKIAAKYVHNVRRESSGTTPPDIKQVIQEALKGAAPEREYDPNDLATVVTKLSKKSIINDKAINEAAKQVVDDSAMEDLKFMVNRNARAMGKRPTADEIETIIQIGKLNPRTVSLPQIRKAVTDYYGLPKDGQAQGQTVKPGAFVPPNDPKNLTFFEKVRLKMRRYGLKSLTKGSRNWMTDEVATVKRMNRQKLLAEGQTIADALVGKMFMFFYDAKTKDDLPYWDKFPLIFVINLYRDGFLGLNLHYLDRNIRLKLFDKLLQFANDKSLDKITKLRLSYGLLKNVARYPEVRPCIKRYLSKQVKSQLLVVQPVDWEIALFLPVEQFQKEKKETVWAESKKKIAQLKRKPVARK